VLSAPQDLRLGMQFSRHGTGPIRPLLQPEILDAEHLHIASEGVHDGLAGYYSLHATG
jgi:hypothetical protein